MDSQFAIFFSHVSPGAVLAVFPVDESRAQKHGKGEAAHRSGKEKGPCDGILLAFPGANEESSRGKGVGEVEFKEGDGVVIPFQKQASFGAHFFDKKCSGGEGEIGDAAEAAGGTGTG